MFPIAFDRVFKQMPKCYIYYQAIFFIYIPYQYLDNEQFFKILRAWLETLLKALCPNYATGGKFIVNGAAWSRLLGWALNHSPFLRVTESFICNSNGSGSLWQKKVFKQPRIDERS